MTKFKFSNTSLKRLSECHPDIQKVLREAIAVSPVDFSVICGYRTKKDQNTAYRKGFSRLKFPESKHNKQPALAVDIVPTRKYGGYDASEETWGMLAGVIMSTANRLGINLTWGGSWKTFVDKPHFELE